MALFSQTNAWYMALLLNRGVKQISTLYVFAKWGPPLLRWSRYVF